MGPRKTVAIRAKRGADLTVTERRTKRRNDPVQQSQLTSPPQAISMMGNRSVTSGRKVDPDFLDRENFRIGNWIRRQHWDSFCNLNVPYYPSLVRNFFENMSLGYESIISTVKDVQIVINEEKLSQLLAIPKTGKCFMTLGKKEEALKAILGKERVTDLRSLQAGQLKLEMRLLHNIVSRIFFPKTGRFDWVNEKEIAFMYHLIEGNQINLPYLMLNQMKEAAKGKRACLPYGMVFTLIFNDFGVSLEGEIAKKLLHTDTYNEKSLLRMGYIKKDNVWVKKASQRQSDSDDDEEDNEEDEEEEEEEEERIDTSTPAETSIPDIAAAVDDQGNDTPVRNIPRSPPTVPCSQQSTSFSSDQFQQISDLLKTGLSSFVGEIKESISQINQQVTQSYQEVRKDIRDLTLRVEVLEQKQRSQDSLHCELIDLRSDFGRLRGAADRFAQEQAQISLSTQQTMKEVKVGIEALMICLLGSSNPTGGASTSSRPPPQPSPRPPPHSHRPPFSSTVRSGTGFPEPSTRVGVASRTRRSRGQAPFRSSRVHAPYTVGISSSDSDESSE